MPLAGDQQRVAGLQRIDRAQDRLGAVGDLEVVEEARVEAVLSNAFAFGGLNAVIALKRA